MKTLSNLKTAGAGRLTSNTLRIASNVADGEIVTIGRDVYEFDMAAPPGAITAGRIRVNCFIGNSPNIVGPALAAAINASNSSGLVAKIAGANELNVYCLNSLLLP